MSNDAMFSSDEVLSVISEIKTKIDEFSSTIGEVNELVDDTIQNGEASAVNGSLGARLYSTWDENKTNAKEFKENFENWVTIITLVTATNENVVADVDNVYHDKNNPNGTMSPLRSAIATGQMTTAERFSTTSFRTWRSYEEAAAAGYSNIKTSREFARGGADLEKYKTYDKYLKAMFDKYNS